jgi:hypothetical protein
MALQNKTKDQVNLKLLQMQSILNLMTQEINVLFTDFTKNSTQSENVVPVQADSGVSLGLTNVTTQQVIANATVLLAKLNVS